MDYRRGTSGPGVPEIKRIKQSEEDNRKLKHIEGEQTMAIYAQKQVMGRKAGPEISLQVVGLRLERGMRQGRAGLQLLEGWPALASGMSSSFSAME